MSEGDGGTDERFEIGEAKIYRASPLGYWGTTISIFVLAFGSFMLIGETTGRPNLVWIDDNGEIATHNLLWIGFVLSLILTGAVALSESGRRIWPREKDALLRAIKPEGHAGIEGMARGVPVRWRRRYMMYFIIGAVAGLGFNVFMIIAQGITPLQYVQSIGLWFLLFSPPLYGLGFRAGVDLSRESRELKRVVREHVDVNLFHLDRLDVLGRIGLRGVVSWLIMAAIILLFVVDPNQMFFAIVAVVVSIVGGLVVFGAAVQSVHRRIVEAKQTELALLHEKMAGYRDAAMEGDADAASALAGLTDYEQWVEQRPEWPISPGVTARLALYILIPILPIIGSYLFEKMADLLITRGGVA